MGIIHAKAQRDHHRKPRSSIEKIKLMSSENRAPFACRSLGVTQEAFRCRGLCWCRRPCTGITRMPSSTSRQQQPASTVDLARDDPGQQARSDGL